MHNISDAYFKLAGRESGRRAGEIQRPILGSTDEKDSGLFLSGSSQLQSTDQIKEAEFGSVSAAANWVAANFQSKYSVFRDLWMDRGIHIK